MCYHALQCISVWYHISLFSMAILLCNTSVTVWYPVLLCDTLSCIWGIYGTAKISWDLCKKNTRGPMVSNVFCIPVYPFTCDGCQKAFYCIAVINHAFWHPWNSMSWRSQWRRGTMCGYDLTAIMGMWCNLKCNTGKGWYNWSGIRRDSYHSTVMGFGSKRLSYIYG